MSIFETLFQCNRSILKKDEKISFSARFQSCMFTKQNKEKMELHTESVVTKPDIQIHSSSTAGSIPTLQRNVPKQQIIIVGDTTEPQGTVAKLQTQNTGPSVSQCSIMEKEVEVEVEVENKLSLPIVDVVPTVYVSVDEPPAVILCINSGPDVKEFDDIVNPTQCDTLFWCIYIAIYGYNDYLQIGRNYGIKELEIKKMVGDSIQKCPSKLKQTNYKITKVSIQEILSDFLTTQKETSMMCLIAMIVHFNINVILVDSTNKFMLEFVSQIDVTLPTYVLYKDSFNKYKIQTTPLSLEHIMNMKKNMICLENYMKPLKTISAYKMEDLIQLAKTVGIYNETEKKKKNELYEQLNNVIMWR